MGKEEHVLVCLSSSPSNPRIVQAAARMAQALDADFTALYVRTSAADKLSDDDRERLRCNTLLAEQNGAAVSVVCGSDVPQQIAEFCRASGVTKLVMGRSGPPKRRFFQKPTLTDEIIAAAPELDIYIIPDAAVDAKYRLRRERSFPRLLPTPRELLISLGMLAAATVLGNLFWYAHSTAANIITVYILGVLLTALFTKSYACSVLISLASVLVFNYFFTEPRMTLHAYEADYPLTFGVMLAASLITGWLANKLQAQAKQSSQAAFRTKVLLDTEQLLQKAGGEAEMVQRTAGQLQKLLERDVLFYPAEESGLGAGRLFSPVSGEGEAPALAGAEREAADWVFEHGGRAGATTDRCAEADCLYLPLGNGDRRFGVVGVRIDGTPMDAFTDSILQSILGECALALENSRNLREKEQAAIQARNEQLRADLLRSISHDLRTPLTSISGYADTLMTSGDRLDAETRQQIFTDIYDDSVWLINLVENLLSITRMEGGQVELNLSPELVSEVIEEALRHTDRRGAARVIRVEQSDELLMARMDARLIIQVIINLVDNAIKYTPAGSHITIGAERQGEMAVIRISDDGPGIPDADKPHVFEMFYTGGSRIADSRRSLGLGLALCRSAVLAHGGEITVADNDPHGTVFSFTLPCDEVDYHE